MVCTSSEAIAVTSPISGLNSCNIDTPDHQIFRQPNLPECFPLLYSGPLHVLVSASSEYHLGNFHPVKLGKIFSKLFVGIQSINSIGAKRVKITFDSVINANACLTSTSLAEHGYTASIPHTLLYCIGVIRLDKSISEEDFWEGHECSAKVISFRRINIKNNENSLIASNLVELKFFSPTLPQKLSIYKVLFDIAPSIRSPVQCSRCLRFGHTAKFCRSKERCSHCGCFDHNESTCGVKTTSPPSCIFCKLGHPSTDRSCSEWLIQKDIKKIMATNNVPFSEASSIKRTGLINKAFTFSDVIKNNNSINTKAVTPSPDFPPLNQHTNLNWKKTNNRNKHKNHVSSPHFPSLPNNYGKSVSPNGCLLNYIEQNRNPNSDCPNWVSSLSQFLSESLSRDPNLISSPSTLQSLIESSLANTHFTLSDNDDTF